MITKKFIILIISLLLGKISNPESSNKIMERLRKYDDDNNTNNKYTSMVLFKY